MEMPDKIYDEMTADIMSTRAENEKLKKQIQRWEDAHSEMAGEIELRRRIAELEAIIEARGGK